MSETSETDRHLDGNAIAGILQEVFVAEFTTIERTCASCGDTAAAGAHRSYRGAGIVLRCPACGDVALCVVLSPEHTVVQLHGTWSMPVTR